MTDRHRRAVQALISIATSIEMERPTGSALAMWCGCLEDILPDCEGSPDQVVPLVVAASDLVKARQPSEINRATATLGKEVRLYFRRATGERYEAWKGAAQ